MTRKFDVIGRPRFAKPQQILYRKGGGSGRPSKQARTQTADFRQDLQPLRVFFTMTEW